MCTVTLAPSEYDPLARGHVASLSRPGSNVTGLSLQQIELTTKQIELLKTALSKLTRVAILWDSFATDQLKAADAASRSLGIRTQPLENSAVPPTTSAARSPWPPKNKPVPSSS